MKVAVVSAIYGGYDQPAVHPPQTVDTEFVLITDREIDAPMWLWRVVVEPRPHMHPRLAAKVPKCRPDWYVDADVWIWLDGSATLKREDSVEQLLTVAGPLAQFVHPERNSITAEAAVSTMLGKYAGQQVTEQAAHYVKRGHQDDWGLWATGCIVYRRSYDFATVGRAWLAEQVRWSYQDQISQPPILAGYGMRPGTIPGNLWDNPLVQFSVHPGGDA